MTVAVEDHSGVKVVRVTGELNGMNSDELSSEIMTLLENRGARLVIDMAGVKFINSMGLSELVTLTAQANAHESKIVLASPSLFVSGVLETTKLDRFFDIYPNIDAAVAKLTA